MKLSKLKEQLSKFDDNADVILFSNGYHEIEVVEHNDGIILSTIGKVCPSVKTAIENGGKEPEPADLCSWGNCDGMEKDE